MVLFKQKANLIICQFFSPAGEKKLDLSSLKKDDRNQRMVLFQERLKIQIYCWKKKEISDSAKTKGF